jgi:hypothetical protein
VARKDKARRRKHRKEKQDRRQREVRTLEFSCTVDPDGEQHLLLRIVQPDGGRMPEAAYEGREAMDRARKWIIGTTAGATGNKRFVERDSEWIYAPSHGPCEGTWWRQSSTPRGAVIHARLPHIETWTGTAQTDRQAALAMSEFQGDYWELLEDLTAEAIVARLAEIRESKLEKPLLASSLSWMYSFQGTLEIFSCQCRPMGRTTNPEDVEIVQQVLALMGVTEDSAVMWTDPSLVGSMSVSKWVHRSQAS